jgi:Glycosyltransferase 61
VLARLLRATFGWETNLSRLAKEVLVLEPGRTETAPPCRFLAHELERVTAVASVTTREAEERRVRGGAVMHGALIARRYSGVAMVCGNLYLRGAKQRVDHGAKLGRRLTLLEEKREAVLTTSFLGRRYFGHAITDDIPLMLLGRQMGRPVRFDTELHRNEQEYCDLFGVESTPCAATYFHNLIVVDDWHQSLNKRLRLSALRSMVLGNATRHAGVFVRRGRSGAARVLRNEDAVASRLALRGFRVLDIESRPSASQVVSMLAGAEVIVGMEGSNLAHAILCASEGAFIVAINPADRFNNVYKDYCDNLGMKYGFTVAAFDGTGGYFADLTSLETLLDETG